MTPPNVAPPRIPHAEFRKHLGSGGFADVYLYRQRMPERDIAVKVIRPDASAEQNGAFEAEANLMAKMSAHPAILSVFGAGVSEDSRSYLMMEYCPPPHLGARARKQQFPVTTVLDIGIRIAGAVETLHRAGVLHRDIKPANILITQFGHPVLTDFGIAVSTQTDDANKDAGFSIPWAPPEQATGDGIIGPTLDVYSLGATLHTLLTGHSPFEIPGGDNREISLLNRVLRDPVPRTGRSDVPPELERILAIAMAKKPEQRYPSILGFAQALQQIQEDMHQRTTPIDVLDDQVSHHTEDSDEDATRVRAFTMIDPAGQMTTPGPTRQQAPNDDEATRAVIRRIDPLSATPPPNVDEATRARTQTWPPTGAQESTPAPPPPIATRPRWGDPATETTITHTPNSPHTTPGVHGTAQGANAENSPFTPGTPTPTGANAYPPPSPAGPIHGTQVASSPDNGAHPATDDHPQEAEQPRSVGRIIVSLLAIIILVGATAFGVWSYLRDEGGTQAPEETPKVTTPDGLPTREKTKPVTGLSGNLNPDGTVTFTWDPATEGDYLYRVADPLENHQIRQSKEPTATVNKVDGRTCLEVFLRHSNGQTSDRAIECVDTP